MIPHLPESKVKGTERNEYSREYYQKNSEAAASLRSGLFEEKILNFIKEKSSITKKTISLKEAEDIIKKFTNPKEELKKTIKNQKNKKKK